MEDNKLSVRKALEMVLQFMGVGYTIYNYTYRHGRSGALLAASAIMYVIGIVRYGERARALWRANLDNIKPQDSSGSADTEETIKMKDDIVASRIRRRLERKDLNDDGEALLLAQDLFPLWQHDMPWSIPLSTPDCPASNGVEHHVQGGGDGALSHVRAPLYIPRRTSRTLGYFATTYILDPLHVAARHCRRRVALLAPSGAGRRPAYQGIFRRHHLRLARR